MRTADGFHSYLKTLSSRFEREHDGGKKKPTTSLDFNQPDEHESVRLQFLQEIVDSATHRALKRQTAPQNTDRSTFAPDESAWFGQSLVWNEPRPRAVSL